MRLTPAARTLVDEVTALRPKAKAKASGEPDGFGVTRSVTFDAATAKWLEPILDAIADRRVATIEDKTVTFVPDTRADFTDPFHIDQADAVLNET